MQPNDFDDRVGVHSTLYLLRRDASLCFGYNPNNGQKIQYEALFPATMAVLAGIDLIAKFVYRDRGNVGDRFRGYVKKYIENNFHEELYQLRNSLLHSFGLYSEGGNKKIYRFVLKRGIRTLIEQDSSGYYFIDVELLWKKFETSISTYNEELIASVDLQQIFSEMFPKYGLIGVQ